MEPDQLSDRELQELMGRLHLDVEVKEKTLKAVRTLLSDLKKNVEQRQSVRSRCKEETFTAEEVAPVVQQGMEVRKELAEKRKQLEDIRQQCAQVKREVNTAADRQPHVAGSDAQMHPLQQKNEEAIALLTELTGVYKDAVKAVDKKNEEIEDLQATISHLKSRHSENKVTKHHSKTAQDMNSKLDKFIMATCRKNGLS